MKFLYVTLLLLGLHQGLLAQDIVDPKVAKSLLTPRQFEVYQESLELLKQSQEKSLTIFYLTTSELDLGAKRFNASIYKLKQKGERIEGKIILRGFPKDILGFLQAIYDKNTPGAIKIHPPIFRAFNVKRVPAYVLAYCPVGRNFAFSDCDNKFLASGDVTLSDFFSRVGDFDKSYKKYYFELIEPK
ncbi:hypothetical protein BKH46_07980 [Helicobacter sp. 12S02634-8]|uniref:TrbC family F-type conjugative pilus assembly protein n=1 Tax=Helicobacter sp. 12S02634-8 TaxID=1476199 RepID=UPI000BA6A994|nr:TrbC family F-type conjugative pilus assembly protein [Helicobacter sp. 12S02634-8]PAF46315.1 hypothetical protein BKH46_07980 [Helicobacter sp. 12S02634-8]